MVQVTSDQLAKSSITVYVLAGIVPAISYVGLSQLYRPEGLPPHALLSLFSFLLLWFFATAIFGFVLGGRRANVLLITVSAFGGICLGVIANAIYDSYAMTIDHNLLPFEILLYAIFTMPGMLCGWAMGQLRYRRKRKD
jgi:hypothetical protein